MNFAIVPAAGRASRLGRPKPMVRLGNTTVLEAILATLERAGVERTVVVVAPGETRAREHCRGRTREVAINQQVAEGMLSSVQCGLRRLSDRLTEDSTLTICPVDFPALRASTVEALFAGLLTSRERLAVPRFAGRRGHPLVMSAELADDIAALGATESLRNLLDRHPPLEVDVDDPGVRLDLDTWLDYRALVDLAVSRARSGAPGL